MYKVRVIAPFKDMLNKTDRKVGDIFEADEVRLKELLKLPYIEVLEEIKEEVITKEETKVIKTSIEETSRKKNKNASKKS